MKLRTATLLLTLPLMTPTAFGQFTGDIDDSFGSGGSLWYANDGYQTEITKLVLDENSESFYFSGSLKSDEDKFDASIVKGTMEGALDDVLSEGTIQYDPFLGLGGLDEQFQSMAVQSNGKMVGAGYVILAPGNSDLMIARFNTDGSFDATFNGGSPFLSMEEGLDFATDVAIQEDGKIVVIGSYQVSPTDLDLFFIRLNSDGTTDGTFGFGGVQVLDTYSGIEQIESVTILENGNIAAIGHAGDDCLMVQLDNEGNFSTDFSGDGYLNFKVNSLPTVGNKIIELNDGKLLISGNTQNEEDGDVGFVIKMDANGNFVSDFNGDDGTLYLNMEEEMGTDTSYSLKDMEVFENGQILLVGDYKTATEDIALVLVNENGEIDTDFGTDGMRVYNLSGGSLPNANSQIEIASNGRVYLSSKVVNGSFQDVVTKRLFSNYAGLFETNPVPEMTFNLYPNPSADVLQMSFNNESAKNVTIEIIDLSGRVLYSQLHALSAGNQTISLTAAIANLPTGSYQVVAMTENGFANNAFIKQ